METTPSREVISELRIIRKDLEYLKQNMVHQDSILTGNDYEALLSYRSEKRAGLLHSHDEVARSLGL